MPFDGENYGSYEDGAARPPTQDSIQHEGHRDE
jgi:hypothetical protein